jgi:hypothetical protein
VGLANLGSESEMCVGSCVHLVGVSISFEKNFYRLPFTPPSLVLHISLTGEGNRSDRCSPQVLAILSTGLTGEGDRSDRSELSCCSCSVSSGLCGFHALVWWFALFA